MKSFKNKKSIVIVSFGFLLILIISLRIIHLGLDKNHSDTRLRFNAIPTAISVLYHNHTHDYTSIASIAYSFQGDGNIDSLINNSISKDINKTGTYFLVSDDKGFVDYVIISFKIFGPKIESLSKLWILFLLISYISYCACFFKNELDLIFVSIILLGIYTLIGILPLTGYNISEQRILEILCIIPTFFIINFIEKSDISYLDLLNLFVQVILLIFFLHGRSTIIYLILFLLFYLLIKSKNNRIARFLLVLIVLSQLLLFFYQNVFYNKNYLNGIYGQRTFFHSALMGLSLNSKYSQHYGIDDQLIASRVIEFSKNGGCDKNSVRELTPTILLNTVGGHGYANWGDYDYCAKILYFRELISNLPNTLKLFFIDKPRNILHILINLKNGQNTLIKVKNFNGKPRTNTIINSRLNFFSPIILIFTAMIIVFSWSKILLLVRKYLLSTALLAIFSLIPSILFYPNLTNIVGFIIFTQIIVILVIFAIFGIIKKFTIKINML